MLLMNLENSKISNAHRLRLDLAFKTDLRRSDLRVGLSRLSIYFTWKNIKESYKNNKFKISGTI